MNVELNPMLDPNPEVDLDCSGFGSNVEPDLNLGMDSYRLYTVLINQNHNNLILHFLA